MRKIRELFGGLGNQMFQYAYLYSLASEGVIPDIYVQNPAFFEQHADEIKKLYGTDIGYSNKISLHVRRGDYLKSSFYVNLAETDYYERAIALFPNEKFLVFCADRQAGSDDISDMEWCKERFKGERFEFFQGKDEIEDLNTMAGCKGHIMANSSFSWWASYLGGGKVVAPKTWFTDGIKRIELLEEWIKI